MEGTHLAVFPGTEKNKYVRLTSSVQQASGPYLSVSRVHQKQNNSTLHKNTVSSSLAFLQPLDHRSRHIDAFLLLPIHTPEGNHRLSWNCGPRLSELAAQAGSSADPVKDPAQHAERDIWTLPEPERWPVHASSPKSGGSDNST